MIDGHASKTMWAADPADKVITCDLLGCLHYPVAPDCCKMFVCVDKVQCKFYNEITEKYSRVKQNIANCSTSREAYFYQFFF